MISVAYWSPTTARPVLATLEDGELTNLVGVTRTLTAGLGADLQAHFHGQLDTTAMKSPYVTYAEAPGDAPFASYDGEHFRIIAAVPDHLMGWEGLGHAPEAGELVTIAEAARRAGVPYQTFWNWSTLPSFPQAVEAQARAQRWDFRHIHEWLLSPHSPVSKYVKAYQLKAAA